jgi:soluble lytic murein transglycosylase-like protein
MRAAIGVLGLLALAGCGRGEPAEPVTRAAPLPTGATPEMMALVARHAQELDIPEELLHRVIQRESDYNPAARNGPYWGLMQILPETAATMGFEGDPAQLLDAETNLRYAGAYLRGAWIVADGDIDEAVQWYASGYYYEARDRCLLVETGLRDEEVRC